MKKGEMKIVQKNVPFPYEVPDKPAGLGDIAIGFHGWFWIQDNTVWEINHTNSKWRAVDISEWYRNTKIN